jgi:hypothetical protein
MKRLTKKEELLLEMEREIARPCPYWRSIPARHLPQFGSSETGKWNSGQQQKRKEGE